MHAGKRKQGRVAGVPADPRLGQRLPILHGTTNDFPTCRGR
jgi:hypothetical protein